MGPSVATGSIYTEPENRYGHLTLNRVGHHTIKRGTLHKKLERTPHNKQRETTQLTGGAP